MEKERKVFIRIGEGKSMKKIFCIFILLAFLFSYFNVYVLSEDMKNNDILIFKEAMVTKIEVYDSLLLYERGTVVPLCYINESNYDLDTRNYYNPQENIDRYSSVITGGGSLVDIEYNPDSDYYSRTKLDDFFTVCYKEYNYSKDKLIQKGYGTDEDITMKDIILDVRAYIDFGNYEYKELTFKEYEELNNSNKGNLTFRIKSINFVLDDNEIGKRNEIIYDGVFLYHNYYLNEKETIRWEMDTHLGSIYFNRGELRVHIFNIFYLNNFDPIGTNYSDYAAKNLLSDSFKRYYSEIEGYPVDQCEFEEKELMTAHLIFLKNTEYNNNKYPDKKDLIDKLKNSNLSTDFPGQVHVFNDPVVDSRIDIIFDDTSPDILQIDSDLPEYPRYFLDNENPLLWNTNYGVRNLVLIRYLNRRIEEIEYIIKYEKKNIGDNDKQLNSLNLDELSSKYNNMESLDSFLRFSKIYNEQLYENLDYYNSSKKNIYNTNSKKIDELIIFTTDLKNKLESEISIKEGKKQRIQSGVAFLFTAIFGVVGALTAILNYIFLTNSEIKLYGIQATGEVNEIKNNRKMCWFIRIMVFAFILAIILTIILFLQ